MKNFLFQVSHISHSSSINKACDFLSVTLTPKLLILVVTYIHYIYVQANTLHIGCYLDHGGQASQKLTQKQDCGTLTYLTSYFSAVQKKKITLPNISPTRILHPNMMVYYL